jgi:hypothetical protein
MGLSLNVVRLTLQVLRFTLQALRFGVVAMPQPVRSVRGARGILPLARGPPRNRPSLRPAVLVIKWVIKLPQYALPPMS